MDILTDGLIKCGLPQEACAPLAEKMEAYIKEIVLFNSAYNLTNTSDHDELVTRHILDSLAAYGEIAQLAGKIAGSSPTMTGAPGTAMTEAACDVGVKPAGAGAAGEAAQLTFADIGSGGGLPGIPLAAAFMLAGLPVQWQLVERMEKRCAFLENCAAILGLKNVTVINSEAERLPPEAYDLITFRAFRPLDKKMTKTLLRIVRPSGHLCAYKAKLSSIQEEMEGIKSLVPDYHIAPLSVPGLEDSERNLVIITK
ncbi:MAG: 16S rRNA (guanine(527)-N(7))-methyltransferase RsmG [Treponema sp.]|nr:16S rRNA (guanine(527)-N(7))-methyltransferase RsmG [Treponema sp.]